MEEKETTPPIPNKTVSKSTYYFATGILSTLMLGMLASFLYVLTISDAQSRKIIKEQSIELKQSQALSSARSYELDSVKSVNASLEYSRAVALSIANRNKATSLIGYKTGDMIYLKPDSAIGYISDIIEGGGTHEYYINCVIHLKDGTTRTVSTDAIFKK